MSLIEDIQVLAFGAADLLNNINESVSDQYKLGYAQGILDAIVTMTKPEIPLTDAPQQMLIMPGPHPFEPLQTDKGE